MPHLKAQHVPHVNNVIAGQARDRNGAVATLHGLILIGVLPVCVGFQQRRHGTFPGSTWGRIAGQGQNDRVRLLARRSVLVGRSALAKWLPPQCRRSLGLETAAKARISTEIFEDV